MESIFFERNLHLAILSNPFVSEDLRRQNLEGVEISQTADYFNLHHSEYGFLHDPKNPWEEARAHWESIDKKNKNVVVCFGLGLGYLFETALEWLAAHPERRMIFFETDKRVIAQFFHLEKAEKILNHPQVKIFPCPVLPTDDQNALYEYFFTKFLWAYIGKTFAMTTLPVFQEKRKEEVVRFFNKFTQAVVTNEMSYHHLMRTSYKVTINRFQNSITELSHTPLKPLENSCKGIPAIICGAGSSILKHIPLLKEAREKALIFAGGTSVTVLNNHGIQPHASGIVDPDPNLPNFLMQTHFEHPFFYKSRSGCEIVGRHHGLRLLTQEIHETSFNEWLSDEMQSSVDTTKNFWTVTDFLVQQACFLGCSPIIFIGTDLSFTQNKYYADSKLSSMDPSCYAVEEKDIYGNPIQTKIDWVSCSKKISAIAKEHPHITFINATEGGIGFKDVPNEPFADCLEKYLHTPFDSQAFFVSKILNVPAEKHDPEQLSLFLKKMKESISASLQIIAKMQKELVNVFTAWQIKSLDEMNPYEGVLKELQQELEKETAYHKILYPSWSLFRKTIHTISDILECPQKVKLTLFGMRSREFDFYHSCATSYLMINLMTQDQIKHQYPHLAQSTSA